jgi:hypothetical protein
MVNMYTYLAHQRDVMIRTINEAPWYKRWLLKRQMKHSLACLTNTLQLFPVDFAGAFEQSKQDLTPQVSDQSAAEKLR